MSQFTFPTRYTRIGSDKILHPRNLLVFGIIGLLFGKVIAGAGMVAAIGLVALPAALFFIGWLLRTPNAALFGSLLNGFLAVGLTRYVDAPWGLMIDGLLFMGWLALLFKKWRKTDWSPLRNDIMGLALLCTWTDFLKSIIGKSHASWRRMLGLEQRLRTLPCRHQGIKHRILQAKKQ